MAEYVSNPVQAVALNEPILFLDSIPCPRRNVLHDNGSGVFVLRGCTNNCFARYKIVYNGNIAIPEGGTAVGPIAVAVTVNGEPRQSSRAIYTPVATGYGNVTSTAIITVPRGCCFTLSVRAVSGITDDPAAVPAPVISAQNNNLTITRIA
jgi:hypothetical protein